MSTDLREHALRVLRHETTHSLPLRLLRERLRPETGDRLPSLAALEQELVRDERFRLLRPPGAPGSVWAGALHAAGIGPEIRVLLAGSPEPGGEPPGPLGRTRDCLLDALDRRGELSAEVSAALAELEEIGARLGAGALTAAAAAPSTTPPPDPRAAARSRRRWRRPPSRPPRSGGYRSG